ncbi:MAG: hypothetical protein HOP13_09160 [Alphaproteobacteria bacterium]|nr:hypothetical protein [Alphaproteobacteria bacterium]
MKEEDPIASCIALLGQLQDLSDRPGEATVRDGQVAFALYDLATKTRALRSDFRRQFASKAKEILAVGGGSPELKAAIEQIGEIEASASDLPPNSVDRGGRSKADVFIITVIDVEKTAVLKAFGVDAEAADRAKAFVDVHDRRCYKARVTKTERRRGERDLQIYITVVGEARNVPCANVCRDIMERFDVDMFLLVGIGGGNSNIVKPGDVIGALGVYYVEGGKRRLTGRLGNIAARLGLSTVDAEVVTVNPLSPAKEYLLDFQPKKSEKLTHYDEITASYTADDWPPGTHTLARDFKYHQGYVMCGEKVLVDGSVKKTASVVNRKLACVDMESYGFASTCAHKGKNWLVFRGVADLADPKKDDARHVSASVAAAVVARSFLKHAYLEVEERGKF